MKKRGYTHVKELVPAIQQMVAEGKTQREIAEYYGFRDKGVVKEALKRERRKEALQVFPSKGDVSQQKHWQSINTKINV